MVALLAGCDNSSGPSVRISRVEVNLPSPTLLIGTNAAAAAHAFDLAGAEVDDAVLTWKSSAEAIVSVNKAGILTAHALGSSTISASVSGVTGSAVITVVPLPVSRVNISPPGGLVDRGQSLQLRAELLDQFNEPITDRQASWTSSAPGIAQVTSSGLVNAIAAGTATITATAEEKSASVTITVVVTPVPGGPSITSITPSLLTPGAVATIRGTNFGETLALNEVRVSGVVATILSASATELTVQLGAAGYGCEPTRLVYVQVVHASAADAQLHALQVVSQRLLQPGEALMLSGAGDVKCIELSATGGSYLISVYNVSTHIDADTAFRLRGAAGLVPSGVAFAASAAPLPQRPAARPRSGAPGPRRADLPELFDDARDAAEADAHRRLLEENLRQLRAGGTVRNEPASARAALRASVTTAQPIGSIVSMKIPDVGGFFAGTADYCRDNFAVSAKVVFNGAKSIILEDVTSPFAGQIDTLYQRLGQEFDDVMYDIDRINFGDPLRMDDLLDANGKIIMLFSPKVNSFNSVAGFVVSCDFKTVQASPSSNHAEVFYSVVPTDPGTDIAKRDTRAGWYRLVRSTVVHEVKHLATFATRIRDFGESYEEPWLEEGLARQAEELWARVAAYNGLLQKTNATYAQTLFCDVRPTSAVQCAGKPWAMMRHFEKNGLFDFLSDPEQHSPLGQKAGLPDGSFYGSTWALTRWLVDNGPTDEPTFFGALVHTELSGVTNLTSRSGKSWEDILGEWSLTLYLDDVPGFTPANPRLTFPSWNLRSIYGGLNTDFPVDFAAPFPLIPHPLPFGDFTFNLGKLSGGSFSLIRLSGAQTGRQLLQLLSPKGGDPSSKLRMAIIRID